VVGILYENVSVGELEALDLFEGINYCRAEVTVLVDRTTTEKSMEKAFTYIWNSEAEKTNGEWSYENHFLPHEEEFLSKL
jgi:uncharacterized protein YlxP (DUF503 family)